MSLLELDKHEMTSREQRVKARRNNKELLEEEVSFPFNESRFDGVLGLGFSGVAFPRRARTRSSSGLRPRPWPIFYDNS